MPCQRTEVFSIAPRYPAQRPPDEPTPSPVAVSIAPPGSSGAARPQAEGARPGRLARTAARLAVHLLHQLQNVCGDDWLSLRVRRRLLRSFGCRIGPGTLIRGGSYFSAPNRFRIGADCFLNRNCYFDLEAPLIIGDTVAFGHGVSVITTRHEMGPSTRRAGPYRGYPVVIGDGAWVGANATILSGVTIGRGAVVGAGALVTQNVPPNVLVGGVPARVLRELPEGGGTRAGRNP